MTARSDRPDRAAAARAGGALSPRAVVGGAAGLAGDLVAARAAAGSLADVPPRGPDAAMSVHSDRSRFVDLARIPRAGPGIRNMLAEAGDGAGVDRSVPLTDEILDEAFVAYGQNRRPAHGFPMRLDRAGKGTNVLD